MLAIIGGTGIYKIDGLEAIENALLTPEAAIPENKRELLNVLRA